MIVSNKKLSAKKLLCKTLFYLLLESVTKTINVIPAIVLFLYFFKAQSPIIRLL